MMMNDRCNLLYERAVVATTWNASLEPNADVDIPKVVILAPEFLCSRFQSVPFAFGRAAFYCPVDNIFGAVRGHLHSNGLTAYFRHGGGSGRD